MTTDAAQTAVCGNCRRYGTFSCSQVQQLIHLKSQVSLIKFDFDRTELFAGMYEVKRELLHLKGYMYQNFTMDENGAAFVKIDKATLEQFGVTASDTSQLVGALGDVQGNLCMDHFH